MGKKEHSSSFLQFLAPLQLNAGATQEPDKNRQSMHPASFPGAWNLGVPPHGERVLLMHRPMSCFSRIVGIAQGARTVPRVSAVDQQGGQRLPKIAKGLEGWNR